MRRVGLAITAVTVAVAGVARAAPDTTQGPQNDPDRAAAMAAVGAFAFGCLERLSSASSAQQYAAGADEIGRQSREHAPQLPGFAIEGFHGDTCRVTYSGAYVDTLWSKLSDVGRTKLDHNCTPAPVAPNRVSVVCTADKDSPAYEETIERMGDRLTASLRWRGPRRP